MAREISISDEDYEALLAAAQRNGTPIETLLHTAIIKQYKLDRTQKQIGEYIYPSGEADTPEEEAEDDEIAARIAMTKPWPSEMLLDDRGPRA